MRVTIRQDQWLRRLLQLFVLTLQGGQSTLLVFRLAAVARQFVDDCG